MCALARNATPRAPVVTVLECGTQNQDMSGGRRDRRRMPPVPTQDALLGSERKTHVVSLKPQLITFLRISYM